ncbi:MULTISPECIES: plant virulence effector HPE1-like domain-containing protein [Rhizobium/Agrobacterium group]|uniref:plant virulence effector HPE1-like domain-containing protein n=1 Tax=Rhizobium/Agrobacterium group TaxID=227290 RepID=UPI0022FFE651|nr:MULTISPECIES: plant virulence effector HPE1-like domain-containing protein [Rhizobium/Agrobacterium group]MDA5632013.1 plant virulence effector HPE1-like domain-containing protein [Agrobacterium sp. ST15.16.024]MDF1887876.1 plant virulence effector HPE1-like domain-containing protein [Rhizobium rhizogenes]
MRRLLLTAIIALTSGSAMASSIEYINGVHTSNGSFIRRDCTDCEPVKDKTTAQGYAIPSIEPGTQHTEMREVDGKRTLIRTEAWLGGAPVTFVSTNPAWMPETSSSAIATYDNAEPVAHPQETVATPAGIDVTTTTAGVKEISTDNAAAPASASVVAAPEFPDFKLRGN